MLINYRYYILIIVAVSGCSLIDSDSREVNIKAVGTVNVLFENGAKRIAENAIVFIDSKFDTTDETGRYEIENLSNSIYEVKIAYADFDTLRTKLDLENARDSLYQDFFIYPDATGEDAFYGTMKYGEFPVEDVKINVYDLVNDTLIHVATTYSDKEGDYRVEGLTKRIKQITFTHQYFEPKNLYGYLKFLGTTPSADCYSENNPGPCIIELENDQLVSNGIVSDYFPLEIGNKWEYEIESVSSYAFTFDTFIGVAVWEVTNMTKISSTTITNIKQTINGTYIKFGGDCGEPTYVQTPDTLIVQNRTHSFSIVEDEGEFTFENEFYPMDCASGKLSPSSLFKRFYVPIIPDTVQFSNGNGANVKLTKNVGINYYEGPYNRDTQGNHRYYINMSLNKFTSANN